MSFVPGCSRPSFRLALIDVSKYFPTGGHVQTLRFLSPYNSSRQVPTAKRARGQNRPAMMDSPEDKGVFMTKTKRGRNRIVVQRRQSLCPSSPNGGRFVIRETINENFYY